ncbi:MAG TPA: hypothetical protein VMX16_15030, partial [Terriglobia bacterium]|nr:hypothetical protein [Terriglobia bacterium]
MRFLVSIWLCCALGAAAQTIKPQIVSKPVDGRVTVVEVRAHFVTAIRMPEAVNSVAVGDPSWFKVEHSDREPNIVFVKALTTKPVETNLLVSAARRSRPTMARASSPGPLPPYSDARLLGQLGRMLFQHPDPARAPAERSSLP